MPGPMLDFGGEGPEKQLWFLGPWRLGVGGRGGQRMYSPVMQIATISFPRDPSQVGLLWLPPCVIHTPTPAPNRDVC